MFSFRRLFANVRSVIRLITWYNCVIMIDGVIEYKLRYAQRITVVHQSFLSVMVFSVFSMLIPKFVVHFMYDFRRDVKQHA